MGSEVLRVEAGWSAVLRLPQMRGRGDVAERLCGRRGVVVHPGCSMGWRNGTGGGEFDWADGGVCRRDWSGSCRVNEVEPW